MSLANFFSPVHRAYPYRIAAIVALSFAIIFTILFSLERHYTHRVMVDISKTSVMNHAQSVSMTLDTISASVVTVLKSYQVFDDAPPFKSTLQRMSTDSFTGHAFFVSLKGEVTEHSSPGMNYSVSELHRLDSLVFKDGLALLPVKITSAGKTVPANAYVKPMFVAGRIVGYIGVVTQIRLNIAEEMILGGPAKSTYKTPSSSSVTVVLNGHDQFDSNFNLIPGGRIDTVDVAYKQAGNLYAAMQDSRHIVGVSKLHNLSGFVVVTMDVDSAFQSEFDNLFKLALFFGIMNFLVVGFLIRQTVVPLVQLSAKVQMYMLKCASNCMNGRRSTDKTFEEIHSEFDRLLNFVDKDRRR